MPENFLISELLPCILGGALIWIWPAKWAGRPRYPLPESARRQLKTTLIVLAATIALSTVLLIVFGGYSGDSEQVDFGLGDVVGQAVGWGLLLLPLIIFVKIDGLGWRELQYRRTHFLSSLLLGTLVGGVFLIAAGKASNLLFIFTASGFFAVLQFLIVGFAEETLFRGYVQVRWVATWGWWRGWLLTSLTMSLFHVPILFISQKLPAVDVLMETLQLLPASLLMGYAMRKSGNIAAPAIIHLWLNFISFL